MTNADHRNSWEGDRGHLKKTETEVLTGIRLTLQCQKGDAAGVILANLACVYEKYGTEKDMELCEKSLRSSYELLSFYGHEKDSLVVNGHYQEIFRSWLV